MGAELGNRSRSLLSQAGSSGLTSGSARETLSGPIKCTRRRSNGWCVSPKQSQRVPAIQPRIMLARDALQGGRIPREISDELFHNAPLFGALVPASSVWHAYKITARFRIYSLCCHENARRTPSALSKRRKVFETRAIVILLSWNKFPDSWFTLCKWRESV